MTRRSRRPTPAEGATTLNMHQTINTSKPIIRGIGLLAASPVKYPLPKPFGLSAGGEPKKRKASDEVDPDPLNSGVGSKLRHPS